MAKVQCYNCRKVTPVVAPRYRCKFCNYPLNKYIEQEKTPSEEVIIEKIKEDTPDSNEATIHDIYRHSQLKEEEKENLQKIVEQLKPDEKFKKTVTGSVILKKNTNPEKDGKIVAGWLVVHTEDKLPITYELYEADNVIGRPDGPHHVDIRIEDDEYVSRVHAIIRIYKDYMHRFRYELLDDGSLRGGYPSTNGTYINGIDERLPQETSVFLRDSDTIQVGTTKLVFKNTDSVDDDYSAVNSVHSTDYTQTVAIRRF